MKIFGPVPSRRLGKSLGINNIPPKVCTYSCIYCQIGKTERLTYERRTFYRIEDLVRETTEKVNELKKRGIEIDFLTFVPDGEPTLDMNLGNIIEQVRPLNIKIAVITNGSLITHGAVRGDLQKADLVSLKIDAMTKKTWFRIDRPHNSLDLNAIQDGMREFARGYKGEIITETMLLKGINDRFEEIKKIADFVALLKPTKSYISIPTRPTAVKGISPASDQILTIAYQVFSEQVSTVEYLMGYEGNEFGFSGNVEEGLLGITSVHPMREDAVRQYLGKAGADWNVVTNLIENGSLKEVEYQGKAFYLRKFQKKA